ncbi:hypothetical protein RF11_03901 [Thelohanellus kitauei]|uniref:Uncharacterized protein n=1 Tax=Thelohanellus kitauei TaxID=669202 RepID=A0A0C2J5P4_THEKT|nr:hypothetical protein RF11_03901 [Thelohanellus kitauei]
MRLNGQLYVCFVVLCLFPMAQTLEDEKAMEIREKCPKAAEPILEVVYFTKEVYALQSKNFDLFAALCMFERIHSEGHPTFEEFDWKCVKQFTLPKGQKWSNLIKRSKEIYDCIEFFQDLLKEETKDFYEHLLPVKEIDEEMGQLIKAFQNEKLKFNYENLALYIREHLGENTLELSRDHGQIQGNAKNGSQEEGTKVVEQPKTDLKKIKKEEKDSKKEEKNKADNDNVEQKETGKEKAGQEETGTEKAGQEETDAEKEGKNETDKVEQEETDTEKI